MNFKDFVTMVVWLHRLRQVDLSEGARKKFQVIQSVVSSTGLEYDHYLPLHRIKSRILAVHGVTLHGKDDPRLVHLSRTLASVGVECFVPHLKNLADFSWFPEDVNDLVSLLKAATTEERVGIVGFSFGGSYALLAAGDPQVQERVSFVLSLGGYSSLAGLYEHFAVLGQGSPPVQKSKERNDWIYLHLVAAHRLRHKIGFPPSVLAAMESLLRRYCHASSTAEKEGFFQRHLEGRDLLSLDQDRMEGERLCHLSPEGKLSRLKCPVGLIHDSADGIVPAQNSCRMAAEMRRSGRPCRLVVTSVLDHVSPSTMLRMGDWMRLAFAFRSVLGSMNARSD